MKTLRTVLAISVVQLLITECTPIQTNALSNDLVASRVARHRQIGNAEALFCGTLPSPLKEKYVIREGDSLVIAVEADCPPGAPTDAKFEFVGEQPGFVNFTFPYRGPRSALAVLLIAPRAGDAGDYRITFDVTHCTGGVGCGRQSFRLKVKRAL